MIDKELAKRIERKKAIYDVLKDSLALKQRFEEIKKQNMISYIWNSEHLEGSNIMWEEVTQIVEEYYRKKEVK